MKSDRKEIADKGIRYIINMEQKVLFEKHEGKKLFYCYSMGGRINFNADNISLCHGIEVGDICLKSKIDDEISPKWYIEKIEKIIDECQKKEYMCRGCSNLKYGTFHFEGIKVVTINTTRKCNSKCVYCPVCQDKSGDSYDPLPFIKSFIQAEIIAEDCLFDWGGGEPILNEYFIDTFNYLCEKGYRQRVNSNCILFSDTIYAALKKGNCILRTSLDAGTEKSFLRVKGVNKFGEVCSNIEKYVQANNDKVLLKYVLNSSNCESESIIGFICFCKRVGVERVCLDADLFSYASNEYNGPLFFTDRELAAAHLFVKLAEKEGINVDIGYIYTAHTDTETRDGNSSNREIYQLPETPVKENWKEIFTKRRYAVVCASLDAAIAEIGQESVVLIGNFSVALFIEQALKKRGITILSKVSDKKINKTDFVKELLSRYQGVVFVVANEKYDKVLQIINNIKVDNFDNKVICMDTFRYIESLNNYKTKMLFIRMLRKLHLMR